LQEYGLENDKERGKQSLAVEDDERKKNEA
jgi:hypothetical protein